ncbi:Transcription factor A [Nesidiocoris tenuis]|uniref:Transcription factor A n=1 Tax=Nesidiocoris tenuis TaxID=355587 RepID=A0ABN7AHS1_9HEMI|nr:Transcription factor A [Nesidiocoris tenuis]
MAPSGHRLSTAAALLKKNLDFIAAHPKPKRPISGFLKFASHVRPTLVKENPSLNVTQLAKLTASKWKEADESLKKKFSDEYLEDKKKYDTALKEYNAAMSKLDPKVVIAREEEIRREKQEKLKSQEKRAMLKRKADLGQPKKPLSSYLMFLQDQRSEQGELPYKEWVAKMTQKWKNMGESEKQTYQSRYLKAKEEHDESMAKWAKRMCEMGNSDVLPKKLIPSPSTSK